jgi:molybdopterin converting factor subunit 1
MIVRVKLFAAARDALNQLDLSIELPEAAEIKQLKVKIASDYPELAELVKRSSFAIDQQYAGEEAKLSSQQEVAMIPPVSGG